MGAVAGIDDDDPGSDVGHQPERRDTTAPSLAARAGAVLLLLSFVVVMTAGWLPPATGAAVSYLVQCATVLTAAVVLGGRARAAHGRLRRARLLLSACLLTVTVAGLLALWVRAASDGTPPLPSVADLVHFLFLPLAVGGMLSYPVGERSEGSARRVLLDGVVAGAALWFAVWTLLLHSTALSSLPPAGMVTALAYPVSDVLVIGVAAGMLLRVAPQARRELALAAAGISLYAVSDIAYTVLTAEGAYRPDSWVAAVAQTGLVLLLLAAVQAGRPSRLREPGLRLLAAVPFVSVAAAVVTGVWAAVVRGGLDRPETVAAAMVASALLARQVVSNRDRGRALGEAHESRVMFRSLVLGSSDLITLHTSTGRVRYASPAVLRLTGLSEEMLLAADLTDVVHPADLAAVRATHARALAAPDGVRPVVLRLKAADGSWRWCETHVRNLLHEPEVNGLVCNTRDIHESHLLQQRLQHDASHDALTGLPNQAAARQHLRRAHTPGTGTPPVVALVDLDGFKEVNDSHGHLFGDQLLVAVSGRIRACVRDADLVARLGGDEFLLLVHDASSAEQVARRVLEALRTPVVIDGRSVAVRASIGLAPLDGATPETSLRDADLAMYAAKAGGRDRVTWFQPDMHEHASARAAVTADLQHALEQDRLTLHYQPIVDLVDGRLAGAEALLRWQREDGSFVPPDVFVPVAEAAGLMPCVDAWVLDRACRDLAAWRAGGTDLPQVSVNVSRRHLTRQLPGLVTDVLTRHGLRPEDLCLEVTESAVAPDPALAEEVLRAIRATGVRVALDDFGTGQSSLSQLADLPVDVVKIDKSFVTRAQGDGGRLLLQSVLAMCGALGLRVVVEGVEDLSTLPWLRSDGCHLAQGYALGRPAPAYALVERARQRSGAQLTGVSSAA